MLTQCKKSIFLRPKSKTNIMKRITFIFVATLFLSSSLSAQLAAYDVGLRKVTTKMWAKPGEEISISGQFSNLGTQVLTHLKISWSIGEGDAQVYDMDGLNMSKSHTVNFTHPDKIVASGTEDIILKVWLSHPNGEQDEKSRNDTLYKTIQLINEFPERMIVLEEFTGAWCGWCPRGPITYRDVIHPTYPNVILAALHNGDDMVTSEGNKVVSAFGAGFPTGMIDRRAIGDYPVALSTNEWMPALNQMDQEFTPAALSIYNYYWPDTYEWKIEVVADFIMDYTGDLRLNCMILEDSVTGTGSGYNQSNYYNDRNEYEELEEAGNPIIGYNHNHVVREFTAGAWGKSGVIPTKAKRGERYIYSIIIKPKAHWDMRQIHLVGLLQAYNSSASARPILNATKTELHMATGYNLNDIETKISVYPNPVSDYAIIDLGSQVDNNSSLEIISISGQTIIQMDADLIANKQHLQVDMKDWKSGIYFVKAIVNNKPQTIKLIKN